MLGLAVGLDKQPRKGRWARLGTVRLRTCEEADV